MPLKTTKKPISTSTKKSVRTAKNVSVFMPVQQTSILLTRRERWVSNLPVVWNAAPARSLVSTAPSNGNIHGMVSVYNIALDDGKQINLRQCGRPDLLPTRYELLSRGPRSLSRASRHSSKYPNSQQTQKHLVERYQSKPQFDPKDFFERGK